MLRRKESRNAKFFGRTPKYTLGKFVQYVYKQKYAEDKRCRDHTWICAALSASYRKETNRGFNPNAPRECSDSGAIRFALQPIGYKAI